MTPMGGRGKSPIAIRRIGIDDHADVRYLHIRAMTEQSFGALSDAEMAAFVAFVNSPDYSDHILAENMYGAFVDGQLVGTAAWQFNGDDGRVARISSVFVHPVFGRLRYRPALAWRGGDACLPVGVCATGNQRYGQRGAVLREARLPRGLARGENAGTQLLSPRRLPAQERAAADADTDYAGRLTSPRHSLTPSPFRDAGPQTDREPEPYALQLRRERKLRFGRQTCVQHEASTQ